MKSPVRGFHVWMQLINDYKKMGGRVTTGADAGFIYDTYGFGYIEELELLQEAGFHPLEVIQSATMNGAKTIFEPKRKPIEFGVIRPGLLADMFLIEENPLQNFKVLFGNGAVRLNDESGEPERVGGVRWTIKDGVVYDAKQLLADVAKMVEVQKHPQTLKAEVEPESEAESNEEGDKEEAAKEENPKSTTDPAKDERAE